MFLFIFFNSIIITFHIIFPKISIITPIYNNNLNLKKCLDNIKNQTLKDIEIICIKDDSSNNILEYLMEYINDNRFIFRRNKNSGNIDSINMGMEFISGKYIGIVESDEYVDINMFENLYKYTYNNNIDIVRYNYHLNKEKKFFFFNLRL